MFPSVMQSKRMAIQLTMLSFHVKAGETAAFVGATGAGKTTIMQLLARFYEVDKGEIYIDGIPISKLPRKTLRSQTAFVLQDPFLFEATVLENIRYGKLDATDEEVIKAAKQANAHSFISRLEDGYDTVLTADGGEISQGQKQLLSIARALVADPVLLLLDEATSSIDTVTELEIQEALDRLMEGRTSFVIAHRLNTVRKADTVYVMEQGKLIEVRRPKRELIERQGVFYNMLTGIESIEKRWKRDKKGYKDIILVALFHFHYFTSSISSNVPSSKSTSRSNFEYVSKPYHWRILSITSC